MTPPQSAKFKNPRARYNFQGRTCSITGVGSYVPARVLTNAELEKMVDTSDEWIVERTCIRDRRVAAKGQCTRDLASDAAIRLLERLATHAAGTHLEDDTTFLMVRRSGQTAPVAPPA